MCFFSLYVDRPITGELISGSFWLNNKEARGGSHMKEAGMLVGCLEVQISDFGLT